MEVEELKGNLDLLEQEMAWFEAVTDAALKLYFQQDAPVASIFEITPPELIGEDYPYAKVVKGFQMGFAERYLLMMALMPHVRPQSLDVFFTKNADFDRGFTEFGGLRGQNHGGFVPTGETAVFVLSLNNLESRVLVQKLFDPNHYFNQSRLLTLAQVKDEPRLSGALQISAEYRTYLISGDRYSPEYSADFPAKPVHTPLDWEDLVLDEMTMDNVLEIRQWMRHRESFSRDWGLDKYVKPGFKCLFYGPPGTGKTLTASLLGKASRLEVYRVDLSMIVSKYIGETEKNLANVFDQAENNQWILFFDEADALFGKRTQTKGSNERYANQEVAYLLQRIEDFPGIILLATNLETNIDEAFMRRFHSTIKFSLPALDQRRQLWIQLFGTYVLDDDRWVLEQAAQKIELAGGALVNILRYCAIHAAEDNRQHIKPSEILGGLRREYEKLGKKAPDGVGVKPA